MACDVSPVAMFFCVIVFLYFSTCLNALHGEVAVEGCPFHMPRLASVLVFFQILSACWMDCWLYLILAIIFHENMLTPPFYKNATHRFWLEHPHLLLRFVDHLASQLRLFVTHLIFFQQFLKDSNYCVWCRSRGRWLPTGFVRLLGGWAVSLLACTSHFWPIHKWTWR